MLAELMKSQFVRRPSVTQLSPNLMRGFLSNFGCCFPWAIRPDFFFNFWKKFFFDFLRIIFVFVNMGPYGSENFKTLPLLQSAAESFQTFPEFSSQWSAQNLEWDFWNFEFAIFNDFFFRKFQIHHCTLWRNQKPQLSEKRAIVEQNGVKFGTRG